MFSKNCNCIFKSNAFIRRLGKETIMCKDELVQACMNGRNAGGLNKIRLQFIVIKL